MVRSEESQVDMPDLNQALRKAMERLGGMKRNVAFRHRLRRNLPRVMYDPGELEQTLLGLLGIAADRLPGGGTLTVETSIASREEARKFIPQPDADLYIALRVRGSALEDRRPVKEESSGLPAVRSMLTAAGANLAVESGSGEAATLVVHFPVSADELSRFIGVHGMKGTKAAGAETILIVDDDQPTVETIREILKALGYRVLTASSGEQALERWEAEESRIDLVLLDVMMPGMKGDDVFRRLKSMAPRTKVIFMSGFNVEKDLRALLTLGFDGFLDKPFKVHELVKIVRSVLKKGA
jgi:CheY-like chemotaxis protein